VHLLLLLCAKQLLLHLLLALALAIFGPCAPPPSPPWHAQRTARVLVGFARHSVPGKYIGRRGVCDVMVVVPGRVVVVAAEVVVAGVLREQGGRLARAKWVGFTCHSPFERLLL
jgi:hypothetical protein